MGTSDHGRPHRATPEVLVSMLPQRALMACWLARAAVEERLHELLGAAGLGVTSRQTRTVLACLSVGFRDQPEVVLAANHAWERLSAACHRHAYELTPSVAEARDLVALVRELVSGVPEVGSSDTERRERNAR